MSPRQSKDAAHHPDRPMSARIAGDVRIAQNCDQQSLHRNGNCLFSLAAILALAARLSFDLDYFLSQLSHESLRQKDFLMESECSNRGLSSSTTSLSSVPAFWKLDLPAKVKNCVIVANR